MTIYKILNNNLILSKDKQGHEIIVKGCGIAFQKKKGQQVDETLIEKIFTAETAQISKEIQGYFASIPEKYLDFVEAYVNEVKEKQGLELNDSIYFSLSDHIMGAISRLNQGIQIQNMLLLDIKQLYHKEYEIGLELLKRVNQTFQVNLVVDEAGFFALHFVNAEDGSKTETLQFNKKGSYIVDIVVEDVVGNQASKLRAKIVVGHLGNHPTLEGINDVEVVQGTRFDIMEGVSASDGNGNDITHQIKILKNTVNTDEVGTYEVIYSITNSQGNNIQRTRKVEVIKNESEKKS